MSGRIFQGNVFQGNVFQLGATVAPPPVTQPVAGPVVGPAPAGPSWFAPFTDYDLGDTVRVIAPSRGIDQAAVVVALYLQEGDDERIRVGIDLSTPRQEYLLGLEEGNRSTASSVGVRNRMPQGTLTAFSIADTVYFDTATPSITTFWVPDRVYVALECKVALDFDEYPMPVSAASSSGSLTSDSGGGATSGSSSAASAGNDSESFGLNTNQTHRHTTSGTYSDYVNGVDTATLGTSLVVSAGGHSHTIAHHHSTPNHDHSVPGHTHSLTRASTKEAYPASHNATLRVYNFDDDAAWDLVTTISGITDDVSEHDLTAYITGPGRWRIVLQSAAAQPNGGRLGAHLSGYLIGAIQVAT